MDQDATWYGCMPWPRRCCVRCGPSSTAGWMKMPVGTEVDLGPGHTVRRGPSSTPTKWARQLPLFSAHIYYGHSRPSQLLLSSCLSICLCLLYICCIFLRIRFCSTNITKLHMCFCPPPTANVYVHTLCRLFIPRPFVAYTDGPATNGLHWVRMVLATNSPGYKRSRV